MSRYLAVSLLALIFLLASHPPALAASDPCATAERLREAGLMDAAEQVYTGALQDGTALTCARDGLQAVARTRATAAQHVAAGETLEQAGRPQAALAAYRAALAISPLDNTALGAVARLELGITTTADPFAAARALANQGLYTAAAEQLAATLRENPQLEIPADLAYLSDGTVLVWPAGQRFMRRWLQPWGLLLLPLAVALFITYRTTRGALRRRIDIQPFRNGPKDLDVGAAVAGLVEEQFLPPARYARLDLVEGNLVHQAVPDSVRKAVPSFWLLDLLHWLLPPNIVLVSGNLLIEGARGAGLSLSLVDKRNGSIRAMITFWDREMHPATATADALPEAEYFYRLSDDAADWLAAVLLPD